MDQVVIDALVASGTNTVANSVGGSNTNLNVAKLRAAKKAMDAKTSAKAVVLLHTLIIWIFAETEVTSSDFNSVKALVTGQVADNTFLRFVQIGDRDEGGLAIDSSNDRIVYAFHKDAMGLGIGMGQQSRVDYIPEKTSFLVASMFSAGSVAIDADNPKSLAANRKRGD